MSASAPRVSVAVPVYNEAAGVPELLRRLGGVLDALPGGPHEIVVVDDGSEDGTLSTLERAAQQDDRLTVVSLSRNFGHQAAFTAALDFVTGDVAILMDGDLQDPPEEIPRLLERHAEGYDVVYALRASRPESWPLRAAYYVFYRLFERLSSLRHPLDSGDFSLVSRRVITELRRTRERHRFLRGLRTWVGFRQVGVPVDRAERFAGRTKYSLRKLAHLAFDGIFAFSIVPIRAAFLLGTVAILASGAFGAYAAYARIVGGTSPRGFTAITLLMIFLAGVQLLFLGIIGEYVGRVYEEVKGRPLYVVSQVIRSSGGGLSALNVPEEMAAGHDPAR